MKPSQVLKNTNVTQVTGELIKYKTHDQEGDVLREPIFLGKCAMGVLACESGNPELKLDENKISVRYNEILKAYDIDYEEVYPYLYSPNNRNDNIRRWDFNDMSNNIADIIIKLNDSHGFTFKEIGEFLEVTFDL